ncbi:partial Type IIS restriction enzyme Eco57I, partial [Anaerolineae bacterium]
FVERALSLLNHDGRLGFILPHKFFNAQYGEPLRDLIAKGRYLSNVVHFGDQQVFTGVTTYTCLMFLDKAGCDACHFVKVDNLAAWRKTGAAIEGDIPADRITAAEWNFNVGGSADLFERLSQMPVKLGDKAFIFVGLQTSADKIYVVDEIAPPKHGSVKVKNQNGDELILEQEILKPFLYGVTVATYEQPVSRHWLIFPYHLKDDGAALISSKEMASAYPQTWDYLKRCASALRGRDGGKWNHDQWYAFGRSQNLTQMKIPKLIVQVISQTGKYALDRRGLYFTGGGNGPYYGMRWNNSDELHSLHFLQALLSSHLIDWYLHKISSPFRGGYWSYGKRFIEQLPIRPIDFTNAADKAAHDRMVKLVDTMLQLHPRLAAAKSAHDQALIQRQIDATDRQIDALVYQLYGLTDDEIKIVEGRA